MFRLARARGLYNTYVTNGYMTPKALQLLIDAGLNAMNVDVKGDAKAVRQCCGRNYRLARQELGSQAGIWLEITTLVIPGVNDAYEVLRGIAGRIVSDLGPDVPWHVSSCYPAYHFTAPPTTTRMLEQAWQVGREAGLRFVYLGNVPGHRSENTYCPNCGALVVKRWGLDVQKCFLDRGSCPDCGRIVPGIWE